MDPSDIRREVCAVQSPLEDRMQEDPHDPLCLPKLWMTEICHDTFRPNRSKVTA